MNIFSNLHSIIIIKLVGHGVDSESGVEGDGDEDHEDVAD
jgi:hypothetical protein